MYTDIKTFEEACQARQVDPANLPDVSMLPERHQKFITAAYKLSIIAEALNDGWSPDWTDPNQYKYTPWFYVDADKDRPRGFGFSRTIYVNWLTYTVVCSRLCFKDSDIALYAGEQFKDLFLDYMLIP